MDGVVPRKLIRYTGRDGSDARVWTCDECGRPFEWSGESSWYGSLRAEDDGDLENMTIYCSHQCRMIIPPGPGRLK